MVKCGPRPEDHDWSDDYLEFSSPEGRRYRRYYCRRCSEVKDEVVSE